MITKQQQAKNSKNSGFRQQPQLSGQVTDARQWIAQRKRMVVGDARQLLLRQVDGKGDAPNAEVITIEDTPEPQSVAFILPKKSIVNDRYRPPQPNPRPQTADYISIEYEEADGSYHRPQPVWQQPRFLAVSATGAQPPQHRWAPQTFPAPAPLPPPLPRSSHRLQNYTSPIGYAHSAAYASAEPYLDGEEYEVALPEKAHFYRHREHDAYLPRQRYERPVVTPHHDAYPHLDKYEEEASFSRPQRREPPPQHLHRPRSLAAPPPPSHRAAATYGYGDRDSYARYPALQIVDNGNDSDVEMLDVQRRERSRSPVRSSMGNSTTAPHHSTHWSAAEGGPSRRRHHQGESSHSLPLPPSQSQSVLPTPLPPPPSSLLSNIIEAYKVSITGLHDKVTRDDIFELFSSVGAVRKCTMLGGGSAEVVYPTREEAQDAIKRYHRRELDGLPMKLRLSIVGIRPSNSAAKSGGGGGTRSSAGHHY